VCDVYAPHDAERSRPCCIKCKRLMCSVSDAGKRRFRCKPCRVVVTHKYAGRAALGEVYRPRDCRGSQAARRLGEADPRPCCVKCRRRMRQTGHVKPDRKHPFVRRTWNCRACGATTYQTATALARRERRTTPSGFVAPARSCGRCANPLKFVCVRSRDGGLNYVCPWCVGHRKAGDYDEALGARLLELAAARIPVNIPAEVRAEAQAAIAADLYAREVAPADLTPFAVRRYVRAAYGFNDDKRFKSLDAPTRGSSTFGALMVG